MTHERARNQTGETTRRRSYRRTPTDVEEPEDLEAQEGNGPAIRHQTAETSAEEDEPMRRAEEMVDRIGERIGTLATYLGHQILRLGARAREEAEDMWAEAQSIRRGEQP
jgi:hypothetical protein